MLTYLLIALGGAIGSVLRAALGTLMVSLTGPDFPWGTILINVVGSFVIACVGSLTATDGRLAAPPELRAFIMVGLCGGFTTFSSFSLQTLDLLRDGRPLPALANVALSLLLCLGAASLGWEAGLAARRSELAASMPAAGRMAERTVVALHRPQSVAPMLEVAGRLMSREPGRRVTIVLAIDQPVLADLQPTEELLTAERRREIAARREDWVAALRPGLDAWVAGQRRDGHRASWLAVRGDGTERVVEHGRSAHLLLLEHDPTDPGSRERTCAALERARRPLLLVPSDRLAEPFGGTVLVRRREGQDEAQAREATRVLGAPQHVITVAAAPGDEDAAREADTLLERARAVGADLLVLHLAPPPTRGRPGALLDAVLAHAATPVLIPPHEA